MDICNCDGLNLPAGDKCGITWYSKLAAMTSRRSPGYAAVLSGTNEVIREASIGLTTTSPIATTTQSVPDAFVTLPPPSDARDDFLQNWIQLMIMDSLMKLG